MPISGDKKKRVNLWIQEIKKEEMAVAAAAVLAMPMFRGSLSFVRPAFANLDCANSADPI